MNDPNSVSKIKRSGLGFHTFKLDDYKEFLHVTAPSFRDNYDYVWRGARDPNWHLISSLTRKLQKRQIGLDYDQWVLESSYLTARQIYTYLLELRGVEELNDAHLGLLEILSEKLSENRKLFSDILNKLTEQQRRLTLELFSKGQHHELATPLLDWTRSPQVALFFAFEKFDNRIEDEGYRVVYALNRAIVEKKLPPGNLVKDNGILFIESMAHRNPRIIGQSGLFTFSPSHLSIEKWVIDNYSTRPTLPVLLRFLIRNKNRRECLADLEQMNIHFRSLFPDLIGVARATNYCLERY